MPALLLPILAKALPYLLGLLAAAATYLWIKHKGATEARTSLQTEATKAIEKRTEEIGKAVSKDTAIDKTVQEKTDALKKQDSSIQPSDFKPGDKFKF